MRRFFYWYLPLSFAVAAAAAFAAGFYSFLRGDTGKPVEALAPVRDAVAAAPPQTIQPIILGDSLARGAGDATGLGIGGRLDEELRRRKVRAKRTTNIAVNGARTGDLLRLLETPNVRHLLSESNVIIVSIGGNDLWSGGGRNAPPENPDQAMDAVLGRVEEVLKVVRQQNPKARIFFVGLYNPFRTGPGGPMLTTLVNRWNARLIERFSGDPNVTIVQTADLFSHRDRLSVDRFHPGDEGYELIARRIADAI
jgi:lysophospholipase L1-like esterase